MAHEIKQGSSAAITITSPFEEGSTRQSFNPDAVLRDYRVGVRSRHISVLGRAEVLAGRAKFGIFGDGKEVAQLAMAYAFRKGDIRSGYYRDQTFMLALGAITVREFFAQLYAHADLEAEPAFGGRSMTGHFATRLLDDRRQLEEPDRDLQLDRRPVADGVADAAPGRPGLGVEGLPTERAAARARRRLLRPRRRGGVRHHRQRELRRGHVLGGGQRGGRAAGADAALDLGRRLRHLGARTSSR